MCAITKIVMNIAGQEVTITVPEARKLYSQLHDLFGKEVQWTFPHSPHPTELRPLRMPWEDDVWVQCGPEIRATH